MRILVGTLHTIENEFHQCVESVQRQSYRYHEHLVLENLGNKEAHDTLFRTFMSRVGEFDLLVKVDADMVLANDELFARIVERFRTTPWLRDLEIAVHDFFTDRLVWGLHAYHRDVRWFEREDHLFTEGAGGCNVRDDERIRDESELAPAAFHCPDPSPFQAFHFGVHRGLKVTQPDREALDAHGSYTHWQNYLRVKERFASTGDRRVGFAVLGYEFAFRGGLRPEHLNFGNPVLPGLLEPYGSLEGSLLADEIRRSARRTFGFLPPRLRRRVLLARRRRTGPGPAFVSIG